MKKTGFLIGAMCGLGLILTAPAAMAATVASYLVGMDPPSMAAEWGESFTTPSGGPWNSLQFNFYADAPPTTPNASGVAFLLSSEYLGRPGDLSPSTAGFIAQSTGVSGDMYVFDSTVALNPNTEYWIYENAPLSITGTTVGVGSPGEHAYGSTGGDFLSFTGAVSNFKLTGTPASSVPEPGSCAFVAISLAGLLFHRKGILKSGF